jgi:hypothetical protein
LLQRVICDDVGFARARVNVERAHFRAVERAGAAPAKDGELVSGFIHGAVAIDAF